MMIFRSESKNARKGIKTSTSPPLMTKRVRQNQKMPVRALRQNSGSKEKQQFHGSESKNARKGIKTGSFLSILNACSSVCQNQKMPVRALRPNRDGDQRFSDFGQNQKMPVRALRLDSPVPLRIIRLSVRIKKCP